jgi:hypothetical protein
MNPNLKENSERNLLMMSKLELEFMQAMDLLKEIVRITKLSV